MKPILALIYAIISIILMLGISFAVSLHRPLLAAVLAVTTVLFIGSGFILKSRTRKRAFRSME
ncbi:MAG: DUF5325 family protein [Gorillibacterium sp.]|nr:DUF5325 family protein [Gorillibacterium sp.]